MKDTNMKDTDIKNTNVLGIPVSLLGKRQLLRIIEEAVRSGRQLTVVAVNARKIVRAVRDPAVKRLLLGFDIFLADGQSVVKATARQTERITGIDLAEAVCRLSAKTGAGIFFYGASEENNLLAQRKLKEKYPDMVIAGYCNGYDDKDATDLIKKSGADIVFVAKGTPLQEQWIMEQGKGSGADILMGIGGALDVFGGKVKRAPKFVRDTGFEWLYRMLREPKRLKQIPEFIQFRRMVRKENKQAYHRIIGGSLCRGKK